MSVADHVTGPVSIAIETSCRLGGVILGLGDRIAARIGFDASWRHGTELVRRLAELLAGKDIRAADVAEVYVSVGPGSFTGTRIGVAVARTLAQAVAGVRCVAVSSPAAIAEGALSLSWQHLGVVLDAREDLIHATLFRRRDGQAVATGPGGVAPPAEFLSAAPRPLVLVGEGLGRHDLRAEGVIIVNPESTDGPPHLPTPEATWRVGRRLAQAGQFTDWAQILPVYCRPPEAVRARDRRHGQSGCRAGMRGKT